MIRQRPQVLGVDITPGTHDDLLNQIRQHLAGGDGLLHVVTANPEYVMTARKDSQFSHAVNASGLVTVDGAGLAVAMRLLHPDVRCERYTGVTLTQDMVQLSHEIGSGVYLLGAGPGVADDAARRLLATHANANIVDTWAEGSPRLEHDEETIRRIRDSGAEILLVAYGAPAQIHWIQRNFAALEGAGIRVVAGIGGALDYISGNVKLAPPVVRRLGLEWLYRLIREPWRWRRQLVLPHFAVLVVAETIRSKIRGDVE